VSNRVKSVSICVDFTKSRFYRPHDNRKCISSLNTVSYLRPLVYQSGCRLEGRWYRPSYLFYRPEGSMKPSSLDTLFHPVGTSLIETDGSSATHSHATSTHPPDCRLPSHDDGQVRSSHTRGFKHSDDGSFSSIFQSA